ncbi:protein adenylyltransferase SelO family protein [Mesorhizobium sp. M0909]|uniref:protein adenylyltransferase SelO family protein n=1 Tax=Mesorhizobium sp. M0909 TaxID=2957024 RepID=UPI0033393348
MAISGETIDYGPCAFMDIYDPRAVFSSIDQIWPLCLCQRAAHRRMEPDAVH